MTLATLSFGAFAEKLSDIEQENFAKQCFSAVNNETNFCRQAIIDIAKKYNEELFNVPHLELEKSNTWRYGAVNIESIGLNGANLVSKVSIDYKCTNNAKHGWTEPEIYTYKLNAECVFTDVNKGSQPKPTFFLTQDFRNNQRLNSNVYAIHPYEKDATYVKVYSSTKDWIDKTEVKRIFLKTGYKKRLKKYFGEYMHTVD